MSYKLKVVVLAVCVLALNVASAPQNASAQTCNDTPPPQQTALPRPVPMGISGGNIRSIIKTKHESGCFSGTLGSLVQDSGNNQYILSNNHVLADQNKAKPGQLILQPGLVDVECARSPSNAVATFSNAIKLKFGARKNTVDAAIAAVEPGEVSPLILFIGRIAGTLASPVIGMGVQKMGRTTCLTTGVVAGLDANIVVNYSDTAKPKNAKFINQIVVTGSTETPTFSGPGDSGSLIVTDDYCPSAVALLFAGSSTGTVTFANPISEVTSKLGVSMVGSCTPSGAEAPSPDVMAQNVGLSAETLAETKSVRDRDEDELMKIPGAVGTGIGKNDQSGEAEIEVYVDKLTRDVQAAAAKDVEGVPVKLIETGPIVAY